MGAAQTEGDEIALAPAHRRVIPRSFAVATKEVTVAQFQRFLQDHAEAARHKFDEKYTATPDGPMIEVSWYQAAQYCRWLSEQEGVPEDQMCYPPVAQIKEGLQPYPDYLRRTGYRLPTEAEWEYACRADTTTARFYGAAEEMLGQYAWYLHNCRDRAWPVGQLKPNPWGLFDLYGNVWEWCQDPLAPYDVGAAGKEDREDLSAVVDARQRILRGGGFFNPASYMRSAYRYRNRPTYQFLSIGFRVARTYR
jgi:formylglycine-generating enzyme required for sulfatase activity